MRIILESLTMAELKQMAAQRFHDLVKAVVDVERGLLAVDAELHSDLEALLLENGSKQESLWGINLYPDIPSEEWIEYDSLINVRPSQGNRSRGIEDDQMRKKIGQILVKRVKR